MPWNLGQVGWALQLDTCYIIEEGLVWMESYPWHSHLVLVLVSYSMISFVVLNHRIEWACPEYCDCLVRFFLEELASSAPERIACNTNFRWKPSQPAALVDLDVQDCCFAFLSNCIASLFSVPRQGCCTSNKKDLG